MRNVTVPTGLASAGTADKATVQPASAFGGPGAVMSADGLASEQYGTGAAAPVAAADAGTVAPSLARPVNSQRATLPGCPSVSACTDRIVDGRLSVPSAAKAATAKK